jgi:Eco57I restriction-modification methylase/TaqI-like C-terminal specificity domain
MALRLTSRSPRRIGLCCLRRPRIAGSSRPVGPTGLRRLEGTLFNDESFQIINAFDWKAEFPFLRKNGFDVVLGNPPYLNIDSVWGKGDPRLDAIRQQYASVYNDKSDIYYYFFAKSISLSSNYVSFICSRAFLESYKGDKLRQFINDTCQVQEIVDFQNYLVFKGVGVTTTIVTLKKGREKNNTVSVFKRIDDTGPPAIPLDPKPEQFTQIAFPQSRLTSDPWNFTSTERLNIFDAIDAVGEPLGNILEISQGMQTGLNSVFGKWEKKDIRALELPKRYYRKRATNTDIQRYHLIDRDEYLLYLEDEASFSSLPTGLKAFLNKNKKELSERAACVRGNCEWWKFTWPLHKNRYLKPRILCPYLAQSNRFCLVINDEFISLTDTTVLFESGQPENIRYFLAVLNSKLIQSRYLAMAKLKSSGIYEYFWNSISRIPIKRINLKDSAEKQAHDRLVLLTMELEAAAERIEQSKIETDIKAAKQRMSALDSEAESLIIKLYGLTEAQVEQVNGGSSLREALKRKPKSRTR